jgi:hypothetical protein
VSDTSWNIGFAVGKLEPVLTDSSTPFTEMTAEVGGATGGAGGVFGGLLVVPPDDPPDDPPDEGFDGVDDDVPGPRELNGSLLSKSENDCSWPASAVG